MSAIRRNDRRTTRNQLSSPYSRPTQAKKTSSWRMPGWLSFLNPLISRGSEEPDEEEASPPDDVTDDSEILVERVLNVPQDPPPPPSPLKSVPSRDARSPKPEFSFESNTVVEEPAPVIVNSVQKVQQFLTANSNRKLNKYEVRGIIHELEKSVTEDEISGKHEPFRFSTSPVPPVPTGTLFSAPGSPDSPSQRAPRTLARNPNGTYQYRGVGSARPRPRYQSSGFGAARAPPANIKLPSPAKTPGDAKRRRTDPAPSAPADGARVPFPLLSPEKDRAAGAPPADGGKPRANGADAPAPAPAPATPRAARLLSPQPTTPAHPSPLRQTWSAPTPSDGEASPPAAAPAPARGATRAASFMAALIQDATPPARAAEVVNPYESASPVRPAPRRAHPRRRPDAPPAPPADAPPHAPEKEAQDAGAALSPQAIIEATVPKGSKRSRPPPELVKNANEAKPAPPRARRAERPSSPEAPARANGVARPPAVVVEEVSDEEESPTKRRKGGAAPRAPAAAEGPVVEELDADAPRARAVTRPAEVLEPASPAPPAREGSPDRPAVARFTAPPKEPSKLRFSVAADAEEADVSRGEGAPMVEDGAVGDKSGDKAVEEPVESKIVEDEVVEDEIVEDEIVEDKPAADAPAPLAPAFAWGKPKATDAPRTAPAVPAPVAIPPISTASPFSFTSKISPTAPAPAPASIPPIQTASPFSFTSKLSPTAPAPVVAPAPVASSSKPAEEPKSPKSAALLVARAELPDFAFTLGTVPATKPGESSRSAAQKSAQVLPAFELPTFDFSSAKGKGKAPAPAGFDWASAGTKAPGGTGADEWTCDTCMLKNPASATAKCTVCDAPKPGAAPAATSGGFNWAAAGAKAPGGTGAAEWTCDTCMLKNPASATAKCTICDAPKPGAAPATTSGGFNWSAAGAKPPGAAGASEWTCNTCMLKNPASATDKCTICDAPKPGAAPATTSSGFNWSAAGAKPPGAASTSEWTCDTCMLKNPASATEKCTICDAPKPGAAPAAKPATPAAAPTMPAPPKAFDWGAAGLKAPGSASTGGTWTCGTCGLKNPASAAEKCTICDATR